MSPVVRSLILMGIVVGGVLVAVTFGRSGGGPGTIVFAPAMWRCDGTERAWTGPVPVGATNVRIEWRAGGPEGELKGSVTSPRAAFEPYAQSDGTFRVTTTDPSALECSLATGRYTMNLRDADSNALLATGEVDLAAP